MKVLKSQLDFLEQFVVVSDTKTVLNDKVCIEVAGDKVHFSLKTDNVVVTSTVELEEKGNEFSVFLPVKSLASLLKTLPDEEEITIQENTISFRGGSYSLEALTDGVPLLREISQYESVPYEEIHLTNLKEFKLVEGFNGIDDSAKANWFESVVSMNKHFIASDGKSIAMVKTENDSRRINLPRIVARLFSSMDQVSVSIRMFENNWMSFVVDDVTYFIPEKRSSIPDMWATTKSGVTLFDRLNIEGNVTLDKSAMKPVMQRMALVVSDKAKKAMYIKFEKGQATFGSIQYNLSNETIDCKYDSEIEGKRVVLSFDVFNAMYQSLKGDSIILGVSPKGVDEVVNITMTDDLNISLGFVKLFDDSAIEQRTEEAA